VTSEAIFFDFLEAGEAARFGSLAGSMLEAEEEDRTKDDRDAEGRTGKW
jgi:hypothetical protein